MTLARQYLLLQTLIIVIVLAGVTGLTLAQTAHSAQVTEGRRALGTAESLAKQSLVQEQLDEAYTGDRSLAAVSESTRQVSGSDFVALARLDGLTIVSSDPRLVNEPLPVEEEALSGRAWVGVTDIDSQTYVLALVPVQDRENSAVLGVAVIGRNFPTAVQRLGDAAPNLLIYLGVSSALGIVGSLLLARRVKRQTLGMEPTEIGALVEHREALLHGVKEGVVALDHRDRITVINDSACQLLHLPPDYVGRGARDTDLDPTVLGILTSATEGPDRLALVQDRVLVFNRMPMTLRGRQIGTVTTLRDRTDLMHLEEELGMSKATSNTLRAQTHEFANQLHVIKGLLRHGQTDDVDRFIDGVRLSQTRFSQQVSSQIRDPAVAALVIAKLSLASEQGVALEVGPDSSLDPLEERLSHDVTSVVGNLVDNALEAVAWSPEKRVDVRVCDDGPRITIEVRDTGPGVASAELEEVFRQGFTTKTSAQGRGFGLALVRLACRRHGGEVTVRTDGGAVFTATLRRDPSA